MSNKLTPKQWAEQFYKKHEKLLGGGCPELVATITALAAAEYWGKQGFEAGRENFYPVNPEDFDPTIMAWESFDQWWNEVTKEDKSDE